MHLGSAGNDEIDNFDVHSNGDIFGAGSFDGTITIGTPRQPGGHDCVVMRWSFSDQPSWAYDWYQQRRTMPRNDECAEDQLFTGGWVSDFIHFEDLGWDYEHMMLGVHDGWLLHTPVEAMSRFRSIAVCGSSDAVHPEYKEGARFGETARPTWGRNRLRRQGGPYGGLADGALKSVEGSWGDSTNR